MTAGGATGSGVAGSGTATTGAGVTARDGVGETDRAGGGGTGAEGAGGAGCAGTDGTEGDEGGSGAEATVNSTQVAPCSDGPSRTTSRSSAFNASRWQRRLANA